MPGGHLSADFLFYRKFLQIPYKIKNNYRTAAEKKYAAKATRRRQRILQSRILCSAGSPLLNECIVLQCFIQIAL